MIKDMNSNADSCWLGLQMAATYLLPGVDLGAGVIKAWFLLTVVCVLAAGCRFSPMLIVRT